MIATIPPKHFLLAFLAGMLSICSGIAQPVAEFSANPSKGCVPLIVNFKDLSTGSPSSWYWEFGNGNTSTLQNPGAIYASPGKYTVKLTVSNAAGTDVETKTSYIEVFATPTAIISPTSASGCRPLPVQFNDASAPGDGAITSWLWDFGDGSISTSQNPLHTYLSAGTFTVSLIVTDVNGCKHQRQLTNVIQVYDLPKPSFTVDDPGSCGTPHTTGFTNTTPGTGYTFEWDFGDGGTSTAAAPSHTYTTQGSFHVKLTATNTVTGCKETYILNNAVAIAPMSIGMKPLTPTTICAGGEVPFQANVTPFSMAYTYFWDFGDGTFSNKSSPKHQYNKAGIYSVRLIVSKPGQCQDSLVNLNYITVLEKPRSVYTLSDSNICKFPTTVNFQATDPNAVQWFWDFGDTTFANVQNPSKTFVKEGEYTVKLITWNALGCTDTAIFPKRVIAWVTRPRFHPDDPYSGCETFSTRFRDSSWSHFPITSYEWDFGDGSPRYKGKTPPVHSWDSGTYNAYLITTNSIGCRDSVKQEIHVGIPIQPDFTATPRKVCNRDTVFFSAIIDAKDKPAVKASWILPGSEATGFEVIDVPHLEPGTYDVTLVFNQNGCPDTITKKDYIEILAPYAKISSDFNPCTQDTVHLWDQSASGHIIEWYLANGDTIRQQRDLRLAFDPSIFPIILYAEDTVTKCKDRDSIFAPGVFMTTDFRFTVGTCVPAQLKITQNLSLNVKKQFWDFGNGVTDTLFQPTKTITYTKGGFYKITLRNMHKDSCFQTRTYTFYVNEDSINMQVSPKKGCLPMTLSLENRSPGNISGMLWDINDGEEQFPADQPLSSYTWKKPVNTPGDSVKIKLLKTTGPGCVSADSFYIIPSGPQAYYQYNKIATCDGIRVVYRRNMPPIPKGNSFFTFHDGSTSTDDFPVMIYKQAGTYTTRLTATDSLGCTYTYTDSVVIAPPNFKAGLKAAPTNSTCPPLLVHFQDSTVFKNTYIRERTWYFGDGSVSKLLNPSHLYLLAGRFTVSLVVIDSAGCKDSISMPELVVINGPTGQYQFDKKTGCTPLQVNFTSQTQRAVKIQWDLGDGKLPYGNNVSNVYTDTGTFIPLLTLEDSFGCKYTMPPIDTIRVYASPQGTVSFSGSCPRTPFSFNSSIQPGSGYISSYVWDFGDGTPTDTGAAPQHTFDKKGIYNVVMVATNSKGCAKVFTTQVRVYGFEPSMHISPNKICMGETAQLQNTSLSDTTVALTEWWVNNNGPFIGNTLQHQFPQKGRFDIKMRLTNVLGCMDSITIKDAILVGDTLPPSPPDIYRVTVDDNDHVRIEWAPDTSVDFDHFELYRIDNPMAPQLIKSTNDPKDTVFTDVIFTLYRSHRYLLQVYNFCGAASLLELSQPHATVELLATPDTNAVGLRWNHYEGWDSVYRYEIYREQLRNPGTFDLIGIVPGKDSTYTDSMVLCDAQFFYRVKALKDPVLSRISWSDTSGAPPIYVPMVLPPPMKRVSVENDNYVIVEWYDDSGNRFPLMKQFVEKSVNQGSSFAPFGNTLDGNTFQVEDHRVSVDKQSYFYRLYAQDSCEDLSPMSGWSKTILLKADTSHEERPTVTWSTYQGWPEGVHHYVVELAEPSGSFIPLADVGPADTQFVDYQTDLNQRPDYCYRVTAFRNNSLAHPGEVWSHSNIDCAPVRSRVFVPNAFTVNADGRNDVFQIKGMYIRNFDLKIYNRWGEQVFSSENINHSWDGTFKGEYAQMDAYMWVLKATGVDNATYTMAGTVTLIR